MKTRTEFRDWLHRYMVEVDNTRPDNHGKIARVAGKLACRHGLGGDFLLRSEQVQSPTQTVALLGDCLKALDAKGNETGPFTVEQVAELWGVSVRTVGDLVRSGRLGCFRPGSGRGVVRITAEQIAEYERSRPTQRHRHL